MRWVAGEQRRALRCVRFPGWVPLTLWVALVFELGACQREVCPPGKVEVRGQCQRATAHSEAVDAGEGARPDAGLRTAVAEVDAASAGVGAGMSADRGDSSVNGNGGQGTGASPQQSADVEPGQRHEGDAEISASEPVDAGRDGGAGDAETCMPGAVGAEACGCPAGFARCTNPLSAGACATRLADDEAHCGRCGAACAPGLGCHEGQCAQWAEQLALGGEATCVLVPGSVPGYQVYCAGSNVSGLLSADLALTHRTSFGPVPEVGPVRELAVGSRHACAVAESGNEVVCWGSNEDGQLGAADPQLERGAVNRIFLEGTTKVAVGNRHSCALNHVGQVFCWGSNDDERLAQSLQRPVSLVPSPVPGLSEVFAIASAGAYTCVVEKEGAVKCWGALQAGVASGGVRSIARESGEMNAIQVSMSAFAPWGLPSAGTRVCALQSGGEVSCWGSPTFEDGSVLGGDHEDYEIARTVRVERAADLAVGLYRSCALADDAVLCWDIRSMAGEVWMGEPRPLLEADGSAVRAVVDLASAPRHGCLRRRSGAVACWGLNAFGQLAVGDYDERAWPQEVIRESAAQGSNAAADL